MKILTDEAEDKLERNKRILIANLRLSPDQWEFFFASYNSKFDLIAKINDFFIIIGFTNIKIRVIINSQAKRKEVRTKWTKRDSSQ